MVKTISIQIFNVFQKIDQHFRNTNMKKKSMNIHIFSNAWLIFSKCIIIFFNKWWIFFYKHLTVYKFLINILQLLVQFVFSNAWTFFMYNIKMFIMF